MADKQHDKPTETEPDGDDAEDFGFETEYEFEDWNDIPDEEASRILRGLESLIPTIIKKSLGNVLSSEDGLRAILGEKNIPKELAGFLLGQIDATRRGILRIVSNEIRVFLENVDFGGELSKILTTLSFEVRTEIRFIPNDERLKPSIKNTVRVKRQAKQDAESADDDDDEPPAVEEPEKKTSSRWSRRKKTDES